MLCLGLLLCSLAIQLQGLEILDPKGMEYIHLRAKGSVGGSVTLDCGPTLPTIYVWAYTGAGTDESVALAYNYGQGAKLQPRPRLSAGLSVPLNSSALVLMELQPTAEGTYTCQALFDVEGGASITFYVTQLDMEEED